MEISLYSEGIGGDAARRRMPGPAGETRNTNKFCRRLSGNFPHAKKIEEDWE